jgi:hypothetical protein
VDSVVLGRKHALGREHRTEGTEFTEGGFEGWLVRASFVDSVVFVRKRAFGREHRTGIAEVRSDVAHKKRSLVMGDTAVRGSR